MKKRSGIDEKYLYEIPEIEEISSISLDREHELKIARDNWKTLWCLYDLRAERDKKCATFSDWEKYIKRNEVMWNRFNTAPDFGNVYVAPPQYMEDMDSEVQNILSLGKLKVAHIIYLAKNSHEDKAMKEWLRYMALYRKMANDRETMVFKTIMAINIGAHFSTLEKLLYIAPELAKTYENEVSLLLKSDEPIFRDPHMMPDDWSLLEPSILSFTGNTNAMRNDYFECAKGFENLANTPHDKYPFSEEIVLCPIDKNHNLFDTAIIYPLIKPGNFIINTIYSMLFNGVLKGHEMLANMKITQVKFRQAQLAIRILADGVKADEVEEYIKNVSENLQNPITKTPFKWDTKDSSLFFLDPRSPDEEKKIMFRVNLRG